MFPQPPGASRHHYATAWKPPNCSLSAVMLYARHPYNPSPTMPTCVAEDILRAPFIQGRRSASLMAYPVRGNRAVGE